MFVKDLYEFLLTRRAKQNLVKNATILGSGHRFGPHSRVGLSDGAKKENVILENACWPLGNISVQANGVVIMHEYSKIGEGDRILCVNRVEIGAYTAIADNVTISDNNNHPIQPEYRKQMRLSDYYSDMRSWKHSANAPIIIGENCWIGSNVRICKGVIIGDNSVVAACSVVTKDVPANCIVAGNPAKVVKSDIDKIPNPTSCPEFNQYLEEKRLLCHSVNQN